MKLALKKHLIRSVDPLHFYADEKLVQLKSWPPKEENHSISCPFHDDKNPSFSLHRLGKYKCFAASCGAKGKNIVSLAEKLWKISFPRTLRRLYHRYCRPIIPGGIQREFRENLWKAPNILAYLRQKKGLSKETIERFQLGFDGDRICIPIRDQFGYLVNIRRHDPFGKKEFGKVLSWRSGYGRPILFPIELVFSSLAQTIFIAEGELKTIRSIQEGHSTVTITGGAGSWDDSMTSLLKGKSVRLIYDSDESGTTGAYRVAGILESVAKDIKIIQLPVKGGIEDFYQEGYSKADLDQLVHDTPFHVRQKDSKTEKTFEPVDLAKASEAKYFQRPIELRCLIAGKDLAPYLPPKKIKITTTSERGLEQAEQLEVSLEHRDVLKLISCSDTQLKGALKEMFDVGKKADCSIEVLETFNIEELRIIPAIELESGGGSYTIRTAYYLGHGIQTNKNYILRGYTVPDPKTQYATHLLLAAEPAEDDIESYQLDARTGTRLAGLFRSGVSDSFLKVSRWYSEHVTKIRRRSDLHIAMDLVFHSPLSFNFNGEYVHKGWLELLVIGDTRCGKGFVAERLVKFYGLGEVVSGENCSFPGLVGGLQQTNKRWIITWGKLPLQDKRLVVIDEGSAIPLQDIGRMSRIRSEGIAEITKIQSEKTRARTRLIWLSNPRSGKPMSSYNYGVETIPELMGAMEDVSRFDFAVSVASNEVPSYLINSTPESKTSADLYNQKDLKALTMWVWSRKPKDIVFTPRAVKDILWLSVELGKLYSSNVPLIQGENVRIKLAKLSVAVAGRMFSTNSKFHKLIVRREHVAFVSKFLTQIYSKPSMAYLAYSKTDIERNSLKNEQAVVVVLKGLGEYELEFIEGMLESKTISVTDMADYTNKDKFMAKELIGKLVRLRCLIKERTYYVKKPAFIKFLRYYHQVLIKEQ